VLQYFRKIWRDIGSPSVHYSIGALTLGGFIAGIVQSPRASEQHSTSLASGEKTCIDCHKGIAHELPDVAGVEGYD
jgi:nitrate/TMAO reductase-like tetraheme cytochrome c subunit